MLQTGTMPDDESYNLVIGLLILTNQIDSALKYMDLSIKSGYTITLDVFMDCVRSCVRAGKLDTLASIIEKCKVLSQSLCSQKLFLMYNTLWHMSPLPAMGFCLLLSRYRCYINFVFL